MTKNLSFLSLVLGSLLVACGPSHVEPEVIIDPVEDIASLSVIDVSKQASLPSQLYIDGLFGTSEGITIAGSSDQPAAYEDIQAGLRTFSIGDHEDTVRISEHQYYTLMVFDKDSVQLTVDAPYEDNKFNVLQLIRWNLIGANPSDYKVDIMGDSLIRNIEVNAFTYVPSESKKVELKLYHKSNSNTTVGTQEIEIEMNKKFTVNILYDPAKEEYGFNTIVQASK
ncbi:hypothetical protein [Sphingobacterium pedocola]|uniref:Uncharacterized protein n=1 Tax=Sphingobacterium pedocola TaxID=2082722 RepID=A0ABR9T7Y5_9SPHI|nr:hypothetical protein [Sphingobacterium pedocola]MBE8721405.1 hypothetical protein [Sphingobacterium pedocola]